jgi:O-antigen ligase
MQSSSEWRAWLPRTWGAGLLFAAVLAALFIKDSLLLSMSVAVTALLLWTAIVAVQCHASGFAIPRNPLVAAMLLFPVWLALTAAWSVAAYISFMNLWGAVAFLLVFLTYILAHDREAIWTSVSTLLLFIGAALAIESLHQFLLLQEHPSSVFDTGHGHAAYLNLIALPASAYFLLQVTDGDTIRDHSRALAGILFLLFLSIFITASYGAILSLILAMGLLLGVSQRHVARRASMILAALLIGAYVSAYVLQAAVGEESRPSFDDINRLVIWKPAWTMLMQSPWFGTGFGTFFLAWPPYQDPADTSAGTFVHNDYLQLWIETGLPGVLLFLAIPAATAWLTLRLLRRPETDARTRIEATGLFGGLLAIGTHSFVDSNFYVLPTMITAGLILARLSELAFRQLRIPVIRFSPSRFVRRKAYLVVTVLLLLIFLLNISGIGIGNVLASLAARQARAGMLMVAEERYDLAQRFTPGDDLILATHADMLRQLLPHLPDTAQEDRKVLFQDAMHLLDRASELNPLRWEPYLVRGQLYQLNPALAGERRQELATTAYQQALRLNPRYILARIAYAQLLLDVGQRREAMELMHAGTTYSYRDSRSLVFYYFLTLQLYKEFDRPDAAASLTAKLRPLEKRLAQTNPLWP